LSRRRNAGGGKIFDDCTPPQNQELRIPTHELLSAAQRAKLLEAHFSMDEREIARYYTLSVKDLQIIRRHRRGHNRLGFSIQLCHLRFPGWALLLPHSLPGQRGLTAVGLNSKSVLPSRARMKSFLPQ
jgi:TnpA family transposase